MSFDKPIFFTNNEDELAEQPANIEVVSSLSKNKVTTVSVSTPTLSRTKPSVEEVAAEPVTFKAIISRAEGLFDSSLTSAGSIDEKTQEKIVASITENDKSPVDFFKDQTGNIHSKLKSVTPNEIKVLIDVVEEITGQRCITNPRDSGFDIGFLGNLLDGFLNKNLLSMADCLFKEATLLGYAGEIVGFLLDGASSMLGNTMGSGATGPLKWLSDNVPTDSFRSLSSNGSFDIAASAVSSYRRPGKMDHVDVVKTAHTITSSLDKIYPNWLGSPDEPDTVDMGVMSNASDDTISLFTEVNEEDGFDSNLSTTAVVSAGYQYGEEDNGTARLSVDYPLAMA